MPVRKLFTVTSTVLLDAGVVTRCRRRVHLEHDPAMSGVEPARPDPAATQRMADAAEHRAMMTERIATAFAGTTNWVTVPDGRPGEQQRRTLQAMADGAEFIARPVLPLDRAGARRGRMDLLVRTDDGYLPVLVVRHRITDGGSGACTSPVDEPFPDARTVDATRKPRSQPRDQLRLAHAWRMLQAAGYAARRDPIGGVIGLDADVVLWHDLGSVSWPNGRSTLTEYDARFADRLAVATAAASGEEALARPSRVLECRGCPWWPVCSVELTEARDVSLVVRGGDADTLRDHGLATVDALAVADPAAPPEGLPATRFADSVVLAKAWLAGLTVVRRVRELSVPRGDIEVDIDMESFGESGAYLWGCLVSGIDVGERHGYHSFATWEPLPTVDEARSFAEFWQWFSALRARAAASGARLRAYCYNELAENRWLLASADRFAGMPGIPSRAEIREFIDSPEWVDLYRVVSEQFLCARGKGLKVIAPAAGFAWRDAEAGGENSMRWYRDSVGMNGAEPDIDQRTRLLAYNEDDVRATYTLREWISGPAPSQVPYAGDL